MVTGAVMAVTAALAAGRPTLAPPAVRSAGQRGPPQRPIPLGPARMSLDRAANDVVTCHRAAAAAAAVWVSRVTVSTGTAGEGC